MMNDLRSVSMKFLLLLLPPLLISAVIVSAVFSLGEFQTLRTEFDEKQNSIFNFQSTVLASPLFNRDDENVQRILKILTVDPDVSSVKYSIFPVKLLLELKAKVKLIRVMLLVFQRIYYFQVRSPMWTITKWGASLLRSEIPILSQLFLIVPYATSCSLGFCL